MTRFFQSGVFLVAFAMSFPATLAFATEARPVLLAMSFEFAPAASMSDALTLGSSDPATRFPVYSIEPNDPTIISVPKTEVPGASPASSGVSK
jgi:hypothetical protein